MPPGETARLPVTSIHQVFQPIYVFFAISLHNLCPPPPTPFFFSFLYRRVPLCFFCEPTSASAVKKVSQSHTCCQHSPAKTVRRHLKMCACVGVLTDVTKKKNQKKDMYRYKPIDDVRSATQTNIARQTGLRLAPLICGRANVNQNLSFDQWVYYY